MRVDGRAGESSSALLSSPPYVPHVSKKCFIPGHVCAVAHESRPLLFAESVVAEAKVSYMSNRR